MLGLPRCPGETGNRQWQSVQPCGRGRVGSQKRDIGSVLRDKTTKPQNGWMRYAANKADSMPSPLLGMTTVPEGSIPQPHQPHPHSLSPKARISSARTAAVKVFTKQRVVRPAKAAL